MIKDRETGRSKGFAFVQMSTDAEAEKAIQVVNGQTLGNRDLRVSIARPGKKIEADLVVLAEAIVVAAIVAAMMRAAVIAVENVVEIVAVIAVETAAVVLEMVVHSVNRLTLLFKSKNF